MTRDQADADGPVDLPRPYVGASLATLALAAVAAVAGLVRNGLYRDAPVLLPQLYGQDLLTLVVAVPALAVSLALAVRGSLRGYVVWLGVTGYLLYTYASYAFMTAFNPLYLVYVALFGLTLFTLVGGAARLDADRLARAVGDRIRAYVVYALLVATMVTALWLSEILPATLSGGVPASAADANLPVNAIHTLDLAVVVPAFVLAAWLLARRHPVGYLLTGILLVKGTTLGASVLAMIVFMTRAGIAVPLPQVIIFAGLTLLGLTLTARFVRALPAADESRTATPLAERTTGAR